MEHLIRVATASDSEAILRVYSPYIKETAITFETEVPDIDEFTNRIEAIGKKYPYLVYIVNEEIVGFAYAAQHRERAAYIYDVDVSIYVIPQYHGCGIAYKLYNLLFKILKELGYYNAYAAYTVPNDRSFRFHEKFGFAIIGTHHNTGYKFGKWHDVIWMEKIINEHDEKPKRIKLMNEFSYEYKTNLYEDACYASDNPLERVDF